MKSFDLQDDELEDAIPSVSKTIDKPHKETKPNAGVKAVDVTKAIPAVPLPGEVGVDDGADEALMMRKNTAPIKETQPSTRDHKKEVAAFVPTQDELSCLVKYWVRRAIDGEYFIFWDQCFGTSDLRAIDFDWNRVNEIAQILGTEKTDKAVTEAFEEEAQTFERHNWIVFRYGTEEERAAYQDLGVGFQDFEYGVAEEMARRVVQRVFRNGVPEQQQALIKDELARYAKKLKSYKRGPHDVIEISGISFPAELRNLVLSTGVDDPQPSCRFGTLSIEQGKALLAKLDEAARKGEDALGALVVQREDHTPPTVKNESASTVSRPPKAPASCGRPDDDVIMECL